MKISYEWLSDYVRLDQSIEEIEEALTLIGFEVEGIETVGVPALSKVVVGEVLKKDQHPNADRLSVCSVKVDDESEPLGIVCGATNFKVGDRVPVAMVGAVLPGNFKIKKSKLRGVSSEGMMCSAKELNLGDDHAGLHIFDDRPQIGTPINDLFPQPDTVFDIEVTPNRPDCLSYTGIARELAAWFRTEMKFPEIETSVSGGTDEDHLLESLEIRDSLACPRYTAWSVRSVTIKESPEWMQRRLRAVGLRPINNVVDCTNYVLLETGQPLHAFDHSKIKEEQLAVRRALAGEGITTLDGKERVLEEGDLVIADGERPLVIAGIMGSLDAEVDDQTRDIVLEVAAFEPTGIRATSRRLGLSSDSSHRFERGVDPAGIEFAASRCIALILETSGGTLGGPPQIVGHLPETITEIQVTPQQIVDRIGFSVQEDEIEAAWERLDFEVTRASEPSDPWTVRIPSFRLDVFRIADLAEEFLRMYGTDRIPEASVGCPAVSALPESGVDQSASRIREHLVANGFNEAFNYTLVSGEEAEFWQPGNTDFLELENPLAKDQSHLRPSLLSGLLNVLRFNRGRSRKDFRFFECGRVFGGNSELMTESFSVAFVSCGPLRKSTWLERESFDFYHASRLLQDLCELAGVGWAADKVGTVVDSRVWSTNRAAEIGERSGVRLSWGALSREVLEKHEIEDPVFAGELIVDPTLLDVSNSSSKPFVPPSSFPRSVKDIAVVVDRGELAEKVRSELEKMATAGVGDFAVEKIQIFDVFEGAGLPEGKKSIAFTIEYGSPSRTLTDKEVGLAFEDLQKRIGSASEIEMR
ncbi:MAG: phenylalanine--tRNA ligase subunit beta [Verrucomicrobiota bacterium]